MAPLVSAADGSAAAARVGILVIEAQVLVRRRRRQRLAVLLGEERRQDVMRDRGGVGAVDAVLEEDDAGNLRVVARREEDEPAVVAVVDVLVLGLRDEARRVGDYLRGAGLAADVVPFDAGAAAGAAAVDHAPHALPDRFELL